MWEMLRVVLRLPTSPTYQLRVRTLYLVAVLWAITDTFLFGTERSFWTSEQHSVGWHLIISSFNVRYVKWAWIKRWAICQLLDDSGLINYSFGWQTLSCVELIRNIFSQSWITSQPRTTFSVYIISCLRWHKYGTKCTAHPSSSEARYLRGIMWQNNGPYYQQGSDNALRAGWMRRLHICVSLEPVVWLLSACSHNK